MLIETCQVIDETDSVITMKSHHLMSLTGAINGPLSDCITFIQQANLLSLLQWISKHVIKSLLCHYQLF